MFYREKRWASCCSELITESRLIGIWAADCCNVSWDRQHLADGRTDGHLQLLQQLRREHWEAGSIARAADAAILAVLYVVSVVSVWSTLGLARPPSKWVAFIHSMSLQPTFCLDVYYGHPCVGHYILPRVLLRSPHGIQPQPCIGVNLAGILGDAQRGPKVNWCRVV